jgi:hypothetical protein
MELSVMDPLPWDYLPLSYVVGFLPFLLSNLGLVKLLMKFHVRPWVGTTILFILNEYVIWAWWYPISRVLGAGYDWLEMAVGSLF